MKMLSNKERVEILKDAKLLYIKYINDKSVKIPIGLCYCINEIYRNKYNAQLIYTCIKYIIPKFNKRFFNIKNKHPYWWPLEDNASRIKALDKLIFYYKYKAPIYDFINKYIFK